MVCASAYCHIPWIHFIQEEEDKYSSFKPGCFGCESRGDIICTGGSTGRDF